MVNSVQLLLEIVLLAAGSYALFWALGYGMTRLLLEDDDTLVALLAPWVGIALTGIVLSFFGLFDNSIWFATPFVAAAGFGYYLVRLRSLWRGLAHQILRSLIHAAFVIAVTTVLMFPVLARSDKLTSFTIGNNDIIDYALTTRFLEDHGLRRYLKPFGGNPPWENPTVAERLVSWQIPSPRWLAYYPLGLLSRLLKHDPAELFSLYVNLLFALFLPLVWAFGRRALGLNAWWLGLGCALTLANPHILYIVYNGFLPQIMGTGFFAAFFALLPGAVDDSRLQATKLVLLALFAAGVLGSYPELFAFLVFTLGFYFLVLAIQTRAWLNFTYKLGILLGLTALFCPYHAARFLPVMLFNTSGLGGWTVTDRYHFLFFQMGGFFSHPHRMTVQPALEWLIGPVLALLVGLGIWSSSKRWLVAWLLCPFLISGAISFAKDWNYRYYKNFTYLYYLAPLAAARGISFLTEIRNRWVSRSVVTFGALVLGAIAIAAGTKSLEAISLARGGDFVPVELKVLEEINSDPAVQNIFFEGAGHWNTLWVAYYLRDKNIAMPEQNPYLRNEIKTLGQPPFDHALVRTQGALTKMLQRRKAKAMREAGPYTLFKVSR